MTAVRLFLVLLFSVAGLAQLPEAPKPKFFDKQTDIELAASALTLSLDGLSTMKVMAYQNAPYNLYEHNPIARPFMNKRYTASLYFGAAFAAEAGGMYLAQRTRMKVVKHIIPWAIVGVETFQTFNNYRYVHRSSARNNCIIANPVNNPCTGVH